MIDSAYTPDDSGQTSEGGWPALTAAVGRAVTSGDPLVERALGAMLDTVERLYDADQLEAWVIPDAVLWCDRIAAKGLYLAGPWAGFIAPYREGFGYPVRSSSGELVYEGPR